jgi:hypothetical protein
MRTWLIDKSALARLAEHAVKASGDRVIHGSHTEAPEAATLT